ncbi:MAG: hypothetical protein QM651_14360 [Rhodoblastus sp.]
MKKAIDWCALVVGLALALFGARWMWTGWDIVQAERGWAALIAGSVMLAGGLIVATLAWTIMRLTGMAAPEPRSRARGESVAPPVAKASIAAPAAAAGAIVAGGAAAASLATPAPDEAGTAEHEPVVEYPVPAATPFEEPPPPPPLPPVVPPTVGELLRMGEDRAARESREKTFEAPEAKIEAPLAEQAAETIVVHETEIRKTVDETPSVETAPDDEIPDEKPAAHIEVAKRDSPPPSEPPPPPEPLRIPEPPPAAADEPAHDDWLEKTAREFDRELGRDGARNDDPLPEPPQPEPKPEPAVVGRYSSGDTNYLMFADGSIEAQTPEGVMRFASLTELKRFVEKRN